MNLTESQAKTLETIIARGGSINGYASQPGVNRNSILALHRYGFIESVPYCEGCEEEEGGKCTEPYGGVCYQPTRITNSGYQALSEFRG